MTTNEMATYCQPYQRFGYLQVSDFYLNLIGEWLRVHRALPASRQSNDVPVLKIFQPIQIELDAMKEKEMELYQALHQWAKYFLTTLNGQFRKLHRDMQRNRMLQQGTNDSCALAHLRMFTHVNHRIIDELRVNAKIEGRELQPIDIENDIVVNYGNYQADEYRDWDTQRVQELCTRDTYKNIVTIQDSIEAVHRHFSNWCHQYHTIVVRNASYSLFAAPRVTSINDLKPEQRPIAQRLFVSFLKIIEFTQSAFNSFAENNPVCHMNLEYLNSIELTPEKYIKVREDFILGNNPAVDGTSTRINPADVIIKRPKIQRTINPVHHLPPQANVPVPANAGPIPTNFMDLASLQQVINRIGQQHQQTSNVSQETIDNLENVLNRRQRHVLLRHLVYNHPVVVVNAPTACGKSRLLAYLMHLKTRKDPAGLTVVVLNSNKAARHLVAIYDRIKDTQTTNQFKLLLLESNQTRFDYHRRHSDTNSTAQTDLHEEARASRYKLKAHLTELNRRYAGSAEDRTALQNLGYNAYVHQVVSIYLHNINVDPNADIPIEYLPEICINFNQTTTIVGTFAMMFRFRNILSEAKHIFVEESSITAHSDTHLLYCQTKAETLVSIGDPLQLHPYRSRNLRQFPRHNVSGSLRISCTIRRCSIDYSVPITPGNR